METTGHERQILKLGITHQTVAVQVQIIRLPSAYEVFMDPPEKGAWKETVKQAVYSEWTERLQTEVEDMSTTHFSTSCSALTKTRMSYITSILSVCHNLWPSVDPEHFTKLILDSSLTSVCRNYIFKIHSIWG